MLRKSALIGASANGPAGNPSVSADGQIVAFVSRATNLVSNDFNGFENVYVFDHGSGQTRLVSVGLSGNAGNGDSLNPRISGDGRFVVFESDASDLVAGDTNSARDVFVRDLVNNTTTLVSVSTSGTQGNTSSDNAVITPDGRFVAFESSAGNLVPGDNNFSNDLFVRDLVNHTTTLVSARNADGTSGNRDSHDPVITPDGRFVAFISNASNLTAEADTNSGFDVFVRDTQNNVTTLVSVAGTGVGAGVATGNSSSQEPVITPDGRFVAFSSTATNLTPDGTGPHSDIFVRDLVNHTTTLVSVSVTGQHYGGNSVEPAISADGNVIAFVDNDIHMMLDPNNPNSPADNVFTYNVFVRNRSAGTTQLVSINASGTATGNGMSGGDGNGTAADVPLVLTPDGRYVGFVSAASDLVAGDNNGAADVFVRDLQNNVTRLVSTTGSGSGNGPSGNALGGTLPTFALSADGQTVAFQSSASNLVAGDNNQAQDVFVRDLGAGTTQLASPRLAELPPEFTADLDSHVMAVSPNGRFVLFRTAADNVVTGISLSSNTHLYLRDRQTGTTQLIDVNPAGTASSSGTVYSAAISADGRYVAFETDATPGSLVSGGSDGNSFFADDVYLRDLQTGTTRLVSSSTSSTLTNPRSGNQGSSLRGLSDDGRWVLFESQATDLVAGFVDGNGSSSGDVFVRDMTLGAEQTYLVSRGTAGPTTSGNGASGGDSVISPDGSKVAFSSSATDLVPGFINNNGSNTDVFVFDLSSFTTQLVSANTAGATSGGNNTSNQPVFSADGLHVGFLSYSSNLVPGYIEEHSSFLSDIFVRDLTTGVTRLGSGRNGLAATSGNGGVNIHGFTLSADGRYVAFDSTSADLVSGDLNSQYDVFVRDTQTNATTLVSVASGGGSGNGGSTGSTISGNGRYVTFVSTSTNLVPGFVDGNTSSQEDAFVRNLQTGTTRLITQNYEGTASGNNDTPIVRLSRDGSTAVVESNASDLYSGDRNASKGNGTDVFAFAVGAGGSIQGRVFEDSNGNGMQDAGEAGLAGWTVFLDSNGNGVPDVGEPTTTTDATGAYVFSNLSPGSYLVATVVLPGFVQTGPVPPGQYAVRLANNGDKATGRDFAVQPQGPDLQASAVSVPASGSIGRTVPITWTVSNASNLAASGSWQDVLFLSPTPVLGSGALLLDTVTHTGGLNVGASYNGSDTVKVPAVPPGNYYVIVQTDQRHQVSGDTQLANNVAASAAPFAVDAVALTPGTPLADAFTAPDQGLYYKVTVAAGGTLSVGLNSTAATGGTALRVRLGSLPTLWDYDAGTSTSGPNQKLPLLNTAGGTYYILAESGFGAAATAGFTLTATTSSILSLNASSPATGGNTGQVTLAIRGANFTSATIASLVQGATILNAVAYDRSSSSLLNATFDLTGAAPGAYNLRLQDGAQSVTAAGAFTVVAGVSHVKATLLGPGGIRVGREDFVVIDYVNDGTVDVPAPLYRVSATGALFRLPEQSDYVADSISFLAVAPDGPAGVLRPGQHGQQLVRVYVPSSTPGDFLQVQLSSMAGSTPVNWASFKDMLRTPDVPADAWDVIWTQFLTQVGITTTDLQHVLDGDATYLSQLGVVTSDVNRLLSFEIQKANTSLIGPVLASRVDASYPTPGLALTFSADFLQPIAGRYRLGPMGRGWVDNWEISATTDASGNVLFDFAGSPRFFVLQPDGSYGGPPDDAVTLTRMGGVYHLREADGTVEQFRPDGKLDFVQDTNGNRITASYDGSGRLVTLTHSSGVALTIAYNDQGRISSVTDQASRVTTYTYDASGEHLLQVTDASGTRSYQYVTGQGSPSENALAQVTAIDGTSTFYTYDAQGRLAGTHKDEGAEPVTLSYDGFAGVTFTDVANNASTVLYDDLGHPELTRDALGRTTTFSYDTAGNLIRTLSPTGLTTLFQYDVRGNLTRETDALGQQTQFVYDTTFNKLLSYTDARGSTTRYSYDTQANLRSITYANGSTEQFSYDPLGNLTETINARGNAINSTYNANGQLTRQTFADGSHQDFTYDAHGNMITARTYDAFGAVTSNILLTYDPADRLTRIDHLDSNRFLKFTYDSGGRRMQSVDQDGYTVNYTYDTLGRLHDLRDGSNNLIVAYTYDNLGRLSRKDLGNGTYTTYGYDNASQLLSLINYAPGGSVNSSFAYTYDGEGRRTSMTTQDGTTTYGYDAIGQLTLVTLPGGRTIAYTYDAAGNRVQVVDSLLGTTTYTTNSVNEYTSINGVAQSYDADGNLTSDGSNTYTWNDLNQLTGVVGPGGTIAYQYDALGNRSAVTQNGVQTQYLIDPTGLGKVVGQYGPGGTVRYAYGLGLVSRTDASGTSFFDFDGNGNTAGITGAGGTYVNRYSYLPFGATSVLFASLTNSFTFAGEVGVTTDGSGLDHMRARDYSPGVGQFLSPDPTGLAGGDTNLRRYVANNPVSLVDPRGTGDNGEYGYNADSGLDPTRGLLTGFGLFHGTLDHNGQATGTEPDYKVADYEKTPSLKVEYAVLHQRIDAIKEQQRRDKREENRERDDSIVWGIFGTVGTVIYLLVTRSHDPNDLIGPGGFGSQQFIQPTSTWGYTIHYANDPPAATAPAQDVAITEPLDPNLDWSTFEFGSFGFGPLVVDVPAGLQQYQTEVDYQNQDGSPLTVDVTLDFNRQTGVATWTLHSIDPATGTFPLDPLAGFLPINDATGRGEGFVTYLVHPNPTLTTSSTIKAGASIVFDVNTPVLTNVYTNTIDSGTPTSTVTALPATESTLSFTVSWAGSDDSGGSGIAGYDVYVSDNNGLPTLWQPGTTATSASYTGLPGHTYSFFSVATDNAGNVQPTPATSQASTTVLLSQTITFTAPTSPISFAPNETVALSATGGGSGNPVVFSIDPSSTGSGSISGNTLTVTGAGTIVLDANQAGDSNYTAAVQVQQTLVVSKASQTIAFASPTSPISFDPNETVTLSATGGGSGNPVVFSIDPSSTGTGSISGSTLTVTGAGTIVLDANQAGDSNYTAAAQVQQTLVVNKADQTITVTQVAPSSSAWNSSFTVAASASSGLPVTISASGAASGSGIGSATFSVSNPVSPATITFSQAGDANYNPATVVTETVAVFSLTKPSSSVAALPPFSPDTFTLSWAGSDSGGPGIASYTIWVSDNGGTPQPIASLTNTTLTSASFTGQPGHTYGFSSIATDSLGTDQATPSAPQASTTVEAQQSVPIGQTVTFTVSGIGTPKPAVQWQVSGDSGQTFSTIPNATTTTYSFPATAAQNGNLYRAVFSNGAGQAPTTATKLTVNSVQVGKPSQALTVAAGTPITLIAAALGSVGATVQWQVSPGKGQPFTSIPGETMLSYTFTPKQADNGKLYQAVFTKPSGTKTGVVTLTVDLPPSMAAIQPANLTFAAGPGQKTFTASIASGTPTPKVQWQVSSDGGLTFSNIPGATTSTLTLSHITAAQDGNRYRALYSNPVGQASSPAAALTVNYAPIITQPPQSQMVLVGQTATFTAAASCDPTPSTVQWQVSGDGGKTYSNIPGANSTTLTVPATALQNRNLYRAVFSNNIGQTASAAAKLTVNFTLQLLGQPQALTVAPGTAITLTTVLPPGSVPVTVQWQVSSNNGQTFTNIRGATGAAYTFTAQLANNGNLYQVLLTKGGSTTMTATFTLTVDALPTVVSAPRNQTVASGQTATFTATATGTPTPALQWQVSTDGGQTFSNIAGATSTQLIVGNVTAGQNRSKYRVVLTNPAGQVFSSAATLIVT